MTNEALPYATVTLKDRAGKTIGGSMANMKGNFIIKLIKEAKLLEVGFIGYNTQFIRLPLLNPKGLKILLHSTSTTLNNVTVSGERTTREFLIDRKVINFGTDIQAAGGTVLEAFEQLPELEVNPTTGELLMRGNSNVKILVNGKPSPLNPQDLLNQINASEVEKVEIITAPSARYQADGLTGIINIVLINKTVKGFEGGVNLNARTNPGYGLDINLKTGIKNINLQSSFAYKNIYYLNKNNNNRFLKVLNQEQQSHLKSDFDGNVNTFNLKADWFINERNDLSASFRHVKNEHNFDVVNHTSFYPEPYTQHNFLNNFHSHKTDVYNLNYRSNFNNEGNKYAAIDLNLNRNNNRLPNTLYINDLFIRQNKLIYNNQILNLAIDYYSPLGKNSLLESGYLLTLKNIENQQVANYSDRSDSANYQYDEKTYAVYALVKYQAGAVGVQLGVRGEHFVSNGTVNNTAEVKRKFSNLFPSIHLQYKASKKINYTLSYNRRVSRPSLFHVNPLTTVNNPQYRREGNPGINPEYTHNIEFGFRYLLKKFTLNHTLYYRHTSNLINRTFRVEDNVTVMSFMNGGKSNAFGTENTISKEFSNKTELSLTASFIFLKANPIFDDLFFKNQYRYSLRSNFKYKFTNKLSGDLQFLYFGKTRRLNIESAARHFINVAFRYKILKEKGSISLRITDLYQGNLYKNTRISNEIREQMVWRGQTRAGIVSFSYNFSKGALQKRKAKAKRYSESGALE